MFYSLNKVDFVLESTPEGIPQFLQTDHRISEEISSNLEISALMALIRIINPKRAAYLAGEPEPVVIYSFDHVGSDQDPPEFLKRVVSSAGGILTTGSDLRPVDLPDPEPLTDTLNRAMQELSAATIQGYEFSESGVALLEKNLSPQSEEDDDFEYWSAVLKLGAFGGELIRRSNGGDWIVANTGAMAQTSCLPFALNTSFRGEPATVNPLGKAIKFFEDGPEESLVPLVSMIKSNP